MKKHLLHIFEPKSWRGPFQSRQPPVGSRQMSRYFLFNCENFDASVCIECFRVIKFANLKLFETRRVCVSHAVYWVLLMLFGFIWSSKLRLWSQANAVGCGTFSSITSCESDAHVRVSFRRKQNLVPHSIQFNSHVAMTITSLYSICAAYVRSFLVTKTCDYDYTTQPTER